MEKKLQFPIGMEDIQLISNKIRKKGRTQKMLVELIVAS
jgi:hypothetical protein